jgi:hypothetical protein
MFVSRQPYRMPVPLGLAQPGEQYWRVVEMATPLPWFIATVELTDTEEGCCFQRSFCISWEHDFVEMLASIPDARPVSLQLVQPPADDTYGWTMRSIARLWRLRESHQGDERPHVVLQTLDGAWLCPVSGDELQSDPADREVIVDLT